MTETTAQQIAAINRAIVEAQARMHDIGGTAGENAHVRELVGQRDALLSEQRIAARRARSNFGREALS